MEGVPTKHTIGNAARGLIQHYFMLSVVIALYLQLICYIIIIKVPNYIIFSHIIQSSFTTMFMQKTKIRTISQYWIYVLEIIDSIMNFHGLDKPLCINISCYLSYNQCNDVYFNSDIVYQQNGLREYSVKFHEIINPIFINVVNFDTFDYIWQNHNYQPKTNIN